jgi:3-oxoadipate enol-lactonase
MSSKRRLPRRQRIEISPQRPFFGRQNFDNTVRSMKHISVGDAQLAVYTGGERGHRMLLVHGFPLNHTLWQPQIDYFIDHCRVIAPDLRGFGTSDATPGTVTMEQMADDMNAVLDQLGVDEKIIFCGLSMGGYVAWQFWRKYKHRVLAMILCDTRACADTEEAASARRKLATATLKDGSEAAAKVMLPKMFAPVTWDEQPQLVEKVRGMMHAASPAGIAAALEGMAQRPAAYDLLPTIDVPTLVIVGEHDAISTADEMRAIADAIPEAGWVEVPNAGHLSNLENPQVVNEAIAEFITL